MIDYRLTMSLTVSGIVPEVGIEKEINVAEKIGWLFRQLRGHRYRKPLMRMIIAQREYVRIDNHVKQLWRAA